MEDSKLFFVFRKVFSDQAYVDDYEFGVEWEKFWLENGYSICYSSWLSIYSDYLDCDNKSVKKAECLNKEAEEIDEVISTTSVSYEREWKCLWDQHIIDQYCRSFKIFSQNFSNSEIRFALLSPEMEGSESSQHDLYNNIPHQELAEMKALGLPTNFKKCKSNVYINSKHKQNDAISSAHINKEVKNVQEKIPTNKKNKLDEISPVDKTLHKYWRKRFSLFSRFSEGIKLDTESWFSVTPEKVAKHIAKKLSCDVVIDAFCGSGGNSIQLATTCLKVIAIDVDPEKISMAKHNAKIYGVEKRIDFVIGDFFQLCSDLKADVVFLSPPWGGPHYIKHSTYDIEKYLLPQPASILLQETRRITGNIAIYLPKNSDISQILKCAGKGNRVEIEQSFLNTKIVALTAYYGNLVSKE